MIAIGQDHTPRVWPQGCGQQGNGHWGVFYARHLHGTGGGQGLLAWPVRNAYSKSIYRCFWRNTCYVTRSNTFKGLTRSKSAQKDGAVHPCTPQPISLPAQRILDRLIVENYQSESAWMTVAAITVHGGHESNVSHLLLAVGRVEVNVQGFVGQCERHHRVLVFAIISHLPIKHIQKNEDHSSNKLLIWIWAFKWTSIQHPIVKQFNYENAEGKWLTMQKHEKKKNFTVYNLISCQHLLHAALCSLYTILMWKVLQKSM